MNKNESTCDIMPVEAPKKPRKPRCPKNFIVVEGGVIVTTTQSLTEAGELFAKKADTGVVVMVYQTIPVTFAPVTTYKRVK